MIAPTIESGAAIRKRREEVRQRGRHAQLPEDRPAAGGVRAHQLDARAGRPTARPRSALIVTGKNVRYAASTATETQSVTPFVPSPTTTIGAIASSGIVCEATT